ncbi:acylphosphatase [Coraliomargarita sp. SDUM461004]|uniref:acylphosphatase n=1 Tax=Thalassobacterium sedimentorum TaxID=3041258 RepID=A0ABU1AH46_9BACT|nr:acylphosphatase [Coraliomargarita sp. SDUM461004]MDQ8194139.1 acylphosphatase [Coraliomargarita sp. SDUM461004]
MNNHVFQMNCWFEGHVQGVGFRYQTVSVAKGFDVTGNVRNLVDGRVHLYAEGEQSEVLAFQAEVASELQNYIRGAEIKTDRGPRACQNFRIEQ